MDAELSITRWFVRLQSQDEEALEILWQHYFPRLVKLAQQRFNADKYPAFAAEDVAQSALYGLYRRVHEGTAEHVASRDDLWRLLVTATRRRVVDAVRREYRLKRGGGIKFTQLCDDIFAPQPTAETLAICNESLTELLSKLRDDTLRGIALLRMEGYSNSEISQQLNVSERTIERKLNLIRGDWQKMIDADET